MEARNLLSVVAICIATTPAIAEQDRPNMVCALGGFSANPRLAKVASAMQRTGYSGCSSEENCVPTALHPGDLILVNRTQGDWTCGYLQRRDNLVWVRSREIRSVRFDPNPLPAAWLGSWQNAEDHIRIRASKTSGKLDLDGLAVWRGQFSVHTGQLSGAAEPNANRLHVVEGAGSDACMVDLTLVSKYLVVTDNNMCGGVNVRFWGIWVRSKQQWGP